MGKFIELYSGCVCKFNMQCEVKLIGRGLLMLFERYWHQHQILGEEEGKLKYIKNVNTAPSLPTGLGWLPVLGDCQGGFHHLVGTRAPCLLLH